MSIYQSTCERFICSPVASGLTAILSAVYFITYPSFSSFILTAALVKGVDMLQKVLVKYDIERFKSFPRPVVEEEPQEEEEVQEEPEPNEELKDDTEYHANDEREEDEEYIPSHKPTLKRRTYNLRNRTE
jgi:hypothetical protein